MIDVFRNLITNAAKYNDKGSRRRNRILGIGHVKGRNEKNAFYVRHNGVVIDPLVPSRELSTR